MMNCQHRLVRWTVGGILIALMIVLRVGWPESDAYPRLSWSSALLTDEGFYIHNARNLVLFGHTRLDGWNNMLIMPLLHLVQIAVFRVWGVGVVQARMISVVCSLLTLILFYDGMRRVWGGAVAGCGALFLGLDHINLLYNRLGFMDTPCVLLMVAAWWAFTRAQELKPQRAASDTIRPADVSPGGWWILCGVVLGAAYTVRGLAALIWWAPIWATLGPVGRLINLKSGVKPADKLQVNSAEWRPVAWYLIGLALAVGIYGLLWWLPNRRELAYVSHYYIGHQLLPHSILRFADNLHKSMDWERGFFPYLLKHTPVQCALIALALVGQIPRFRSWYLSTLLLGESRQLAGGAQRYMAAWLGTLSLFCCTVNYSPSRYYVLFYPALAALAAVTLTRLLNHHRLLRHQGRSDVLIALVFALWATVNAAWMYDWLAHLSYRQREADRWLAAHLPPDSVVLGAVAPGLCMNNRLRTVNVIEQLCNDDHPVERIGPAPGYILIIDRAWREKWWKVHYPGLLTSDRCLHTFPRLLRSFFYIGLYPANGRGAASFQEFAAHKRSE